jgi:Uma2 family endonuclease
MMKVEQTVLAEPPISVAEWGAMEGEPFYELVNGYLREKPQVPVWHNILLLDLVSYLVPYVKTHALGEMIGPRTPLRITAYDGRKPDMFLIPTDQYHLVGKNTFRGVPPVVLEIVSPGTEHIDRTEKRAEYAQLGVGQYWIIDSPNRAVEVYQLRDLPEGGRTYELTETARDEGVFRPSFFPGLEIPLGKVWPTEFENRTDD